MTTSQTWTTEQDDYLRQHYASTPTSDLAEVLGRTYGAVSARAGRRLGLHKDKATLQESARRATLARSIWTATLDEILALMYPHCASQLIAELLGIKATVINARADRKGLKKTKQHLRDAQYQRMANNPEPYLAARLKPGNVPWNKGTKGLQIGGKDTQFRKGNTPQTSVPVSSESWTTPGRRRLKKVSYLRRKVAEPNVWKFVHIIVWEEANGPVPPGHIVRFVDGNTTNITLGNLVCITRSENSRRNSPWTTMPRELAEVVNMRGQLVRQINKAKRRSAAADTTATEATAPQNNISEVRKMLLDQMAALRNSTTPEAMRQEIERGQCLSQIAQVITNTAKVEVDYIKATGQEKNPFLETATTAGAHQPAIATTVQAGPGNGISSITRHTLRG